MLVVGGTYREICKEPEIDNLLGSGLRATLAISRANQNMEYYSIIDSFDKPEVEALASTFNFKALLSERSYPIQFCYDIPIATPKTLSPHPLQMNLVQLDCSNKSILAFGMLEAVLNLKAERLVIDPQGLNSLETQFNWSADHVAIVGNRNEITAISANANISDLTQRAEWIRKKYNADAVLVKCGALGCIVVDAAGVSQIGVFPTAKVNPLGSGDIFSAVFAYYWAEREFSPKDAARLASKATATAVSGGAAQVLNKKGEVISTCNDREICGKEVKVYIAAPFFTISERWLVNLCRDALFDLGAKVFSPFHDVGWGPPELVAPDDLKGLKKADSVLALLDGFDSGTIFEVGQARAYGLPVTGFISNLHDNNLTMLLGTGVAIPGDISSAIYNVIWQGMRRKQI